jgi:hypothetical protein
LEPLAGLVEQTAATVGLAERRLSGHTYMPLVAVPASRANWLLPVRLVEVVVDRPQSAVMGRDQTPLVVRRLEPAGQLRPMLMVEPEPEQEPDSVPSMGAHLVERL